MTLTKEDRDLLFAVAGDLQERVDSDGFHSLSEAEKTVYCVWQFTAEINSGGADRYFFYDGATYTDATVRALLSLGRIELARALEDAKRIFAGVDLSSIDARQERMEAFTDEEEAELGKLSRPVIAYGPEPDLWRLICEHRRDFRYLQNA